MNILILGDNEIFPGSLKNMLPKHDLKSDIVTCSSVELGLKIIESINFDIVFIDSSLDRSNNIGLLENIKEIARKVYVVLIIDPNNYDYLERAIGLGIDDYLVKPLEERDLLARIKIAILGKAQKETVNIISGRNNAHKKLSNEVTESFEERSEIFVNPYINDKELNQESAAPVNKLSDNFSVDDIPLDAVSFVEQEETMPGLEQGMLPPRRNKYSRSNNWFGSAARILGNVIFVCLLLMISVMAFYLVKSRIAGGTPSIAGHQMYIVLSGSMNPAFDTGSLIFVRPVDPEEITAGDIITFKGTAGDRLTTHRVVEVNNEDGLSFVTRGDANNVNDPARAKPEDVVGRMSFHIPYFGYLMHFAQTKQGLILLIYIPGIIIIITELRNVLRYLKEGKKKKKVRQRAENAISQSAARD